MSTPNIELPGATAVDEYIGRVDASARGLPPDRRAELLDQLREHLDAVARMPGASEASVCAAIDRLGDPADIVASELDHRDGPAPGAGSSPAVPSSSWGPLEVIAVLLLIGGSFVLPVVGPLAGLVCAWLSPAWTRREKWIATALSSGTIVLLAGFFIALIV
jgi:hypothetical protein